MGGTRTDRGCNSGNCALLPCLCARAWTFRRRRLISAVAPRLDGELNYKNPDWLDPPEAFAKKDGTYLAAHRFHRAITTFEKGEGGIATRHAFL
jgi:hypothetical protein